jgi:LysM repeat protein
MSSYDVLQNNFTVTDGVKKMSSEVFQYIIQPEDTIWDLAEEFDTTEEDIMEVNPGLNLDNLFINQVINIPGDAVSALQYRRRFRRFRRPYYYRPYRPYRYYRPRRPYYPYHRY